MKPMAKTQQRYERGKKWAAARLAGECQAVAETPEGGRNDRLNIAAVKVGHYTPHGWIDEAEAVEQLTAAARRAPGPAPLTETEIAATIRSGMEKGKSEPKDPPLDDDAEEAPATRQDGAHAGGPPHAGAAPSSKPPAWSFPAPVALADLTNPDPPRRWLWQGLLALNTVTLFTALWKSGKTTLLAHLLRAFAQDKTFCGLAVEPARVLYVSEEHPQDWIERRDAMQLAGPFHLLCRPYLHTPSHAEWQAFLHYLAQERDRLQADLLILDTLTEFWPVQDENDAPEVKKAYLPLKALARGAAVLLLHHPRKGDGPEATASRGSGALPSSADIVMELRRPNPHDHEGPRRALKAYGRPQHVLKQQIVVELTEQGYVAHGSPAEATTKDDVEIIADVLPAGEPGWTWEEVKAHWPGEDSPGKARLLKALHAGGVARRWCEAGAGTKGSPLRFYHRAP